MGLTREINRRQAVASLASMLTVSATGFPLCSAVAASARKIYHLVPRKVADGIWMIEGATDYFSDENGGAIVNCALIETSNGIVIVDSGPSLRYGVALREVVSELNQNGVAAVINTHHHPDHFFGNQVFKDKQIFALGGTRQAAENEGEDFSNNMYRLLGDWMRGTESTPPNTELTSSTLLIGGREFAIYPLNGHTDTDLALLDKKTGTLITGDLAFLHRAPTTPHANLANWQSSIDTLKTIDASGIIPGHGPFDTRQQSLIQTSGYLTWLDKTLRASASEGLDMVELLDVRPPTEYASMGAMPEEFHRSVAHLYPDIERQTLPLVNR